jgi:hypothetical protein
MKLNSNNKFKVKTLLLLSLFFCSFVSSATYTDVTYSSIQCMKPNSYYIFNLSNYYTFNPSINSPVSSCEDIYRIRTNARCENPENSGQYTEQYGVVNIDGAYQYAQVDMLLFGIATDGPILTIQTFNTVTGNTFLDYSYIRLMKLTSGSWCSNTVYSNEFTISDINISSACPNPTYFNYGGEQNQSNQTINFTTNSTISNLTAYYTFNNTLNDSLGNYGFTKTGSSDSYVIGKLDNSLQLNGATGGYVNRSSANFPIGASSRSVNFWFKMNAINSTANSNPLLSTGTFFAQHLFNIDVNGATPKLRFWGHSLDIEGTTTINTGTWYMATLTTNGTLTKLYLNGNYEGNSTTTMNTGSNNYIYLGYQYLSGTYYTNAVFDELGFFNKSLNTTEISSLYNSNNGYNPLRAEYSENHTVYFNNSIPNINIIQNQTYNISINNYITSSNLSDQIFCNMSTCTPLNNFCLNYSAGYGSNNADYYDILNYGNYLYLYSYFRNYSSNFSVSCCNYYSSCASQVVLFNISSTQVFPPQLIGSLQFINLTTTNYTQPLTSIFTNFDKIQVITGNFSNLTCNYNNWSSNINYTYSENITIQLQCNKNFGSLTPVLVIKSNGTKNFNSTINVTAFNSYGQISDWFIGFNGNVTNPFQDYINCTNYTTCAICCHTSYCSSSLYIITYTDNSTCYNNLDLDTPFNQDTCDAKTISGFICLFYTNLRDSFPITDLNGNTLTTLNKLYIAIIIMIVLGLIVIFSLSKIDAMNDTLKLWIIGIMEILLFLFFTFSINYISVEAFIGLIVLFIILGFLFKFLGGNKNG